MRKLAVAAAMSCALVAAPALATPGPLVIFFDLDMDEFTPQAEGILDIIALQIAATGSTQVYLAGHADRSGPDEYNIHLSQRRASKVRAYLVRRGIPDGVITQEAFGEAKPLVETADGVPEAQNRRVEIMWGPAPTPPVHP